MVRFYASTWVRGVNVERIQVGTDLFDWGKVLHERNRSSVRKLCDSSIGGGSENLCGGGSSLQHSALGGKRIAGGVVRKVFCTAHGCRCNSELSQSNALVFWLNYMARARRVHMFSGRRSPEYQPA